MTDGENPVTARIIEAGDLEYKVSVDKAKRIGEGRWRRRDFPRSMLIQFDTEEACGRAMRDGVIRVVFEPKTL